MSLGTRSSFIEFQPANDLTDSRSPIVLFTDCPVSRLSCRRLSSSQVPINTRRVLIYDGECGFCKRSLGWAINLGISCEHQAWQSLDLSAVGLTEPEVISAAWFVDHQGRLWRGHLAIAQALQTSTHPLVRVLGAVLGSRVASPIGRWTYGWIADHRYQLPGGTPKCKLG